MAADDRYVFEHSGPTHLSAIDWTWEPHRISITATLVRACYVMHYDRRNHRQGTEALAPSWWKFFHFDLIFEILDKDKPTIFGAIFQYNPPSDGCKHVKAHNAPKYVIALRGTSLRSFGDIILDLKIMINRLHSTKRTVIALKNVHGFVAAHESANIWIAGHSLGSSIGMYVGKHMAKDYGVLLETYLFNPPFISLYEWFKSKRAKHLVYGARSLTRLTRAGIDKVARALGKNTNMTDESFDRLSKWVPYLFVNAKDPICSGYIDYFEEWEKLLQTIPGSYFRRISMKVTKLALFFKVVDAIAGKDLADPEPLHLLPSASVTKILSHPHRFPTSHILDQWWKADLAVQSKRYQFDS